MTLSRVVDIIKNQSFPAGMSDMVGAMVAQRINSAEFILGLAHREYDNIMGEIIKLFLGPKGKRIIITGSGFGLTLRLRDHNARVSSGARVALSTISAIKMAMERNPDCNGGVFYIIPETMTARGRTTPDFAWINGSTAVYLEAKGTRNGDRAGEQVKKGIRQLMGTHVAPEVDQLVRFGGKTIGGRFVMLDVTGTSGSHQGICDAIVDTFKGIESEIRRNNLPIDQIADQLRSVRGIEVLVTYDDALWGVKYDPMLRRYQVMRLHSSRKKGETKVRAAHHAMSGL